MREAYNKSYHGILAWPIDGPQMDEANRQLNSTVVQLAMQLKMELIILITLPLLQFSLYSLCFDTDNLVQ
jgi:hypothetical protein